MGLFRAVLAIITDWYSWSASDLELRNIIFAMVFAIVMLLEIMKKSSTTLRVIFGLIYGILMIIHFVVTGFEPYAQFTALSSVVLLALVYRGIWMYLMPSLFLGAIIILVIDPSFYSFLNLASEDASSPNRWDTNYWISALAIGGLIYYSIETYASRMKSLDQISKELEVSNRKLEQQNRQVTESKLELEEVNGQLDLRVKDRTKELFVKNEAMENYIKLNTQEIIQPLQKTIAAINKLEEKELDNEFIPLIQQSGKELEQIFSSIKKTLENEGRLSRGDIL